jgi:Asp-tRNA(Asn)/Glu-tRNA(Gln) amidotransferase A subunit family amidase
MPTTPARGSNAKTRGDPHATVPFNLTGLPALSVPFAFSSDQLPINVQLVSKWLDENTILRLGVQIESETKANRRHPNLSIVGNSRECLRSGQL